MVYVKKFEIIYLSPKRPNPRTKWTEKPRTNFVSVLNMSKMRSWFFNFLPKLMRKNCAVWFEINQNHFILIHNVFCFFPLFRNNDSQKIFCLFNLLLTNLSYIYYISLWILIVFKRPFARNMNCIYNSICICM